MSIDIAKLTKLLNGLEQPLPWHLHEGDLVTEEHQDVYWAERDCPNAEFIVAAANAVPELLEEVERLRKDNGRISGHLKQLATLLRDMLERHIGEAATAWCYCIDCKNSRNALKQLG